MFVAELYEAQQQREKLLDRLIPEIERFVKLLNVPMDADMELFVQARALLQGCNIALKYIHSIASNVQKFTTTRAKEMVDLELTLDTLMDEHAQLKLEVRNARLMSKSIASRIGSIKSKRFSPLWDLIWSLTDKSVNCQMLCKMKEFQKLAFDILLRAESKDGVVSSLGILVNISNWMFGLNAITKMVEGSNCSIFRTLIELNKKFGEKRVRQLTLYLIRNLTKDEDMCFACLRENIIDFIIWRFDEFDEGAERTALAMIMDRLTQPQFSKTLEFYAGERVDDLLTKLTGKDFAVARTRLTPVSKVRENHQVQRFGIMRTCP